MPDSRHRRLACVWLLAGGVFATPAFAQGSRVDLAGEWAARVHEDAVYRGAGGLLGDCTGLPINAAARQMAESWDADVLSQPERMAQAWPAVYSMRGEGPNLRISEVRDPVSEQLIALRLVGIFGCSDRTIWVDGRDHPSHFAEYTWDGFSTGTFHDGRGDYAIALPLLFVTSLATVTSRALGTASVYEAELHRRGLAWQLTLEGRRVTRNPP